MMKKEKFLRLLKVCTFFFVTCYLSCTSERETAFTRMQAHFSEDTLHHAIATYYQAYARYHHGVQRTLVDSLGQPATITYEGFPSDTAFLYHLRLNSYKYVEGPSLPDEKAMTDAALERRINVMAEVRELPWCRDIAWDDFCQYVLPYRNGDEELNDWYLSFREKYLHTIPDSVADTSSIREVTYYLIRCLQRDIKYGTQLGRFYQCKFLTPEEIERMHTVECKALAHYGTLALRSCGIPCTMLETFWRFTEVVHSSILIPQVKGNEHAFRLSIYDEPQDMGLPKDSMASWRTWSYEFTPNPDLMELADDPDVPQSFSLPVNRHDRTAIFSTTHEFVRPVPDSLSMRRHLFLCRFHNWRWYPIREGRVKDGAVHFKDATIRQWYRLGYMEADTVKTFGETFTLLGDGRIQPYDSKGDTVMYKLVYNCQPEENKEQRQVTSYYWSWSSTPDHREWTPVTGRATLWGLNEKTGEYRIFHESMRKDFKPVFHLLEVHLPQWTVFNDDSMPRPLGYIVTDSISNEGYFMQF